MENKEKNEIIRYEIISEEIDEMDEDGDWENTDVEIKPMWQLMKEQQYAKLNVTEKQLNIVIALASAALAVLVIVIGLDAAGVF